MDYGFRKADHAIVHGEALAPEVHELFGTATDKIHIIPHVAMGAVADMETVPEEPATALLFGRFCD